MAGGLQTLRCACVRACAGRPQLNDIMRFSAFLRSLARRAYPALAVALLALPASGALWLEGPQSTFQTAGPVAKDQLHLFYITLWVTLILFVITGSALAVATLKFRAKTEADEHAAPPPQSHGNPVVELGLTIGSIVCLLFIAVPTLHSIKYTYDVENGETPGKLAKLVEEGKAYRIKATGYQWWFKFEYPTEKTAAGSDLVTANELVIPAGMPVHIDLRTGDVIHSFWVPKLGGKVDMIPNRPNHLWLQADEPGYYFGQCAEYCGDSHSIMKFRVIALAKDDFAKWLAAQKQPARAAAPLAPTPAAKGTMAVLNLDGRDRLAPLAGTGDASVAFTAWQARQQPAPAQENTALISAGRRLFRDNNCIMCHAIRGQEGIGTNAPDLTHVGARSTIAAGLLENNPERMKDWLIEPDYWKPSNKMFHGITYPVKMAGYLKLDESGQPQMNPTGQPVRNIALTDADATALTAYLQSLK